MRIALTLLIVMVVLALSVEANTTENAYLTAFTAFITKFRKSYAASAFAKTLAVFKQNVDRIAQLNKKKLGFTAGVTRFSDLSTKEFVAKFTGDIGSSSAFLEAGADAESGAELLADSDMSAEAVQAAFAEGFDWRSRPGVVKIPRYQGTCGSCWAFTTLGTIESALAIKGTPVKEYLSPQLMAECACSKCVGGSYTCGFGHAKKTGYYLESQKPYTGTLSACNKALPPHGKIAGFKHVSGNDANYIALVKQNPAYIAMRAGEELQFYSKGILSNCSSSSPNHAVTLIGFGSAGTGSYFLIRNSWGDSWGENGYFRLANGACGMNSRGGTIPTL